MSSNGCLKGRTICGKVEGHCKQENPRTKGETDRSSGMIGVFDFYHEEKQKQDYLQAGRAWQILRNKE